jgi:prepilin-type N-terminal cleavage/methylation domain-containing protein
MMFYNDFMSLKSKKNLKAFTLAEVLITLLIIGVVASLVIPSLINNTQEAEFKVAAKKAFGEISNVVNQMKMDKGSLEFYNGNPSSFKPDFMNYFSILKDCHGADCVTAVEPSPIYKSLTGEPAAGWLGGEGQFITNDGMFINIQNSANTTIGVMIAVDINGYDKAPNVYGKDVFVFQIVNSKLLPSGSTGSYYSATSYCNRSINAAQQGFGCAVYMLQDKDY